MPPPTLASKRKFTLCFSASLIRPAPNFSTSSLFEVHTLLPASIEAFTKSYAGFVPPIVSTTIVISSSFNKLLKSCVISFSAASPGKSLRSQIRFTLISSPALTAMLLLFVLKTSKTPEPTVPYPIIPTFTICHL